DVNLFAYCGNCPIDRTDPTGLKMRNNSTECCTDEKINEGKEKLKKKQEETKKTLEDEQKSKSGPRKSCYNWNSRVHGELPYVPCWECHLENRRYEYTQVAAIIAAGNNDHWIVICSSRDQKGNPKD